MIIACPLLDFPLVPWALQPAYCNHLLSPAAAKPFLGQDCCLFAFIHGAPVCCTWLLVSVTVLLIWKCLIWICFNFYCRYKSLSLMQQLPKAKQSFVSDAVLDWNCTMLAWFYIVVMRFLCDFCFHGAVFSRGMLLALYSLQARHTDCFSVLLHAVLGARHVPGGSCKAARRLTQCILRRHII